MDPLMNEWIFQIWVLGQPWSTYGFPYFHLDGFRPGCLRFRGQAKAMDVGKVIQDQAIHQPKPVTTDGMG